MLRAAGRLLYSLCSALLVCAVHAQVGVTISGGPDRTSPFHQFQPYTAEFIITHVQTLADGTTVTSEGTEIRARDSTGIGKRTRELVNLTLEEPDPSLFQPPADYNVTTEEMHKVACKQ